MPTEIEHKYLIHAERWKNVVPERSEEVKQAYLHSEPGKTIRVRTMGDKGFITIKGKTVNASRPEFEYEIPLGDANELIRNFTTNLIEKIRHFVMHENMLWEVDEFKGLNAGLWIAEIELSHENETYALPDWVNENVTGEKKYSNSRLAEKPFCKW